MHAHNHSHTWTRLFNKPSLIHITLFLLSPKTPSLHQLLLPRQQTETDEGEWIVRRKREKPKMGRCSHLSFVSPKVNYKYLPPSFTCCTTGNVEKTNSLWSRHFAQPNKYSTTTVCVLKPYLPFLCVCLCVWKRGQLSAVHNEVYIFL